MESTDPYALMSSAIDECPDLAQCLGANENSDEPACIIDVSTDNKVDINVYSIQV